MSHFNPSTEEPLAPTLYAIEHCADTYVDACLRDEGGRLLLLSVFGRDTAMKELQARIHLGSQHPQGLSEMVLKPVEDVSSRKPQRVVVGDPKALLKLTGRLPKCVYGNLTHMWLYHPALKAPQKGADVAWVVVQSTNPDELHSRDSPLAQEVYARLWSSITHLANIPLLAHWKAPVIEAIVKAGMALRMGQSGNDQVHPTMSAPIGHFVVVKVQLDQDRLAEIVTDMVKRQVLKLESPAPMDVAPTDSAASTMSAAPLTLAA